MQAPKKGYLAEDFRIFYNLDSGKRDFAYHYHEFHKIFILLSGDVSYCVEDQQVDLLPGDVVVVPAGQIHKPIVRSSQPYERLILYISDRFFTAFAKEEGDLANVFAQCSSDHNYLVRETGKNRERLEQLMVQLKNSVSVASELSPILRRLLTGELLVLLGMYEKRIEKKESEEETQEGSDRINPDISFVMRYIAANLTDPELDIDTLAGEVARDRYYLMHLFKAETGYTIGSYITQKRLFLARRMIAAGQNATEAAFACGFRNYAAYYHARKKYAQEASTNLTKE